MRPAFAFLMPCCAVTLGGSAGTRSLSCDSERLCYGCRPPPRFLLSLSSMAGRFRKFLLCFIVFLLSLTYSPRPNHNSSEWLKLRQPSGSIVMIQNLERVGHVNRVRTCEQNSMKVDYNSVGRAEPNTGYKKCKTCTGLFLLVGAITMIVVFR